MRAYGWLGLLLLLFSEYCLFRRIEPFYSWFYSFAWWSYILLADNLLFRLRGRSLFTSRRAELLGMLPLSVFVWLLFEGYNLVIRNWAYEGVPANPWIRWPGYCLAFATVLPGIFITSELIEHWVFRSRNDTCASECETLAAEQPSHPSRGFAILGFLLSVAPLVWPRLFFPAVWIGPIFLLDPLLEKLGVQSLSLQISSGNRRRAWSLLLGGLACGVMWEFWNFWAGSKWVYTVPFFGNLKVFEMPVLGFLGFPPFALECWILYHLLTALQRRHGLAPVRIAFWLAVTAISAVLLLGLDRHTVLHFALSLGRIIGPCSLV